MQVIWLAKILPQSHFQVLPQSRGFKINKKIIVSLKTMHNNCQDYCYQPECISTL